MRTAGLIVLTAVSGTLAGCQGFSAFSNSSVERPSVSSDATSYFAQLVDEGRLHLRANRPGRAIVSFRRASYHPDYAGVSYNGMAVAYDMIGREDLAERFFLAAVEADPLDERFSRNLARFEENRSSDGQVHLAAAEDTTEATPISENVELAEAMEELSDEVPTRMQRVSDREVTIAARDDWGARLNSMELGRQAVIHVGRANRPALAAVADERAQYPIQFSITDIPSDLEQDAEHSVMGSALRREDGEVYVRVSRAIREHDRPSYPITYTFGPS